MALCLLYLGTFSWWMRLAYPPYDNLFKIEK